MPRAVTAGTIITDARALADAENDLHTSAAQALQWVSQEYALLRDRLDAADPLLNLASQTFASVAGVRSYTLPNDFKSIIALWLTRGTARYPVDPFGVHERDIGDLTYSAPGGLPSVRYRVRGQGTDGTNVRLEFDRDPGVNTFECEYIPAPAVISSTATPIDGVAGWEERIACGVARRMLIRSERDHLPVEKMIMEIDAQIALMAAQRDTGRPSVVQDVRSRRAWW